MDEIKSLIITYFKNSKNKSSVAQKLNRFLKSNPHVEIYLNQQLNKIPEFENIKNVVYSIVFKEEIRRCKFCNKLLKYSNYCRGNIYCSKKCANLDPDIIEKNRNHRESTNLKKYGVKSIFEKNDFQKNYKEKSIKKYNVDHPSKLDIQKEKTKETNLKKYGSIAPAGSEIIKEKIRETNLKKYGGPSPAHSILIKNKIIKTNLKRYGFKDKKILSAWYNILEKWKNYIVPMFSIDNFYGYDDTEYQWKCVKCGHIFFQRIYTTHHLNENQFIPRCLKCYPFNTRSSNKEKELVEFCKQYFPNLNENNRSLIKPLELDIVIDDIKLALEFNGSFYHSIQNNFGVYIGYHLNKTVECNQKGYRLIHIWEDEWDNNKEIIKQRLIDIFTGNEIIDFSKPLDRSWYNNLKGNFEELPPEIIKRGKFEVENCGYLILK